MERTCKYCKHCKKDEEYDPFNPTGMLFGAAIIGAPISLPGFPGSYKEIIKCDNWNSPLYGDKVDEYDSCSKFEE